MAVKKNEADNAAYLKLKKDLSAGTLGQLYVLHGEEAYLRDYYLGRMKEQLVGEGMAEFNLHTIDGKEFTVDLLEQTVDCLPMMSERTMVLVTDYDLSQGGDEVRERLAALFAQLPEYCCVVFVYDLFPYKLDARTKLALSIKEHGSVVEFARQGQGDLVDWVHRRFKALGKEIDSEQARYLIFLCGDLMNGLIGEIEKVGAYAKSGRITKEDIDAVATPQLDAVAWQMTNAIGAGDFDRAAQVLGDLLQMKEPALGILAAIGKNLRQLYSARILMEQHGTAGDLAQMWGMKPYPAQKLMDSARRFSLPWCRKAVELCARTDFVLKDNRDEREVMTDFLLQLATPTKQK